MTLTFRLLNGITGDPCHSSMPFNAVEFQYFHKVYFCHYLAFMTAQPNHHLCQGGIVSFVCSSVLRITLKVVDEFPFNVFFGG